MDSQSSGEGVPDGAHRKHAAELFFDEGRCDERRAKAGIQTPPTPCWRPDIVKSRSRMLVDLNEPQIMVAGTWICTLEKCARQKTDKT